MKKLRLVLLAFAVLLPPSAQSADWIYTARPGDNLWNLSEKFLERGISMTERLRRHNGIADPLRIRPGTRINMPVDWLKIEPASAVVVSTAGQAWYHVAGASAGTALAAGQRLRVGDTVKTGASGSATVEFADGSRLLVQSSTEVVMDSLSAYSGTGMVDTRMRVPSGRVETEVKPAAGPGSRFEIDTPAAVAAVRGTSFRVGSDLASPTARMRAEVLEGALKVGSGEHATAVPAGFGVLAEAGEPPPAPRELLGAPDLGALQPVVETLVMGFDWSDVSGAEGYRAQLFASERLEKLLLDEVVVESRVSWNAPDDGTYVLRIRAIDEVGLEGLDSVHPFELDARPVPPALLGPAEGARLREDQPVSLWWAVPETSVEFRLRLTGRDAGAGPLVSLDDVTGSRLELDTPLPPGKYDWRLASVDAQGNVGPYSPAFSFEVQAVPDEPSATPPALEETSVRFGWSPVADAEHYEFQLARDEQFQQLLVATTVDEPAYTLAAPLPEGVVFFRVRGVSSEQVEGPYSVASRVDLPVEPVYWPLLFLLVPFLL